MTTQLIRKAVAQGDVYVIPEMSSFSTGWMQSTDSFVCRKAFPSRGSTEQAGKYKVFPRGFFYRDEMKKRADGARSQRVDLEVAEKSYFCNVFAAHTPLGPQIRANATKIQLDQAATKLLSMKAMLSQEIEWHSLYFAAGKWTTDITGVASGVGAGEFLSFADAAALPMATMRTAIRDQHKLTGFRPNKAIFDQQTWDVFREHPNVISRVNGGQTQGFAQVTRQQVAQVLELDEILVSSAVKVTTGEDTSPTTDTGAFVADNGILLLHVNPSASVLEPTAGVTFDWTGYLGGAGEFGQIIRSWYDQATLSQIYEIEQARDQHQCSADMGTFLASPLAT